MRAGARGRRSSLPAVAAALTAVALAGCDDQMKYVPIFSSMTEQPSVEAFEAEPRTPVPGTMPVDGERSLGLLAADTMLSNPLAASAEEVARGGQRFREFCTPCHGPQGAGNGPVVGPNRIPPVPMLDLHTDRARAFSDGYVWGMITEGRGLMPGYRRIPPDDRWRIVLFVRELQASGAIAVGEDGAEADGPAESVGARAERTHGPAEATDRSMDTADGPAGAAGRDAGGDG